MEKEKKGFTKIITIILLLVITVLLVLVVFKVKDLKDENTKLNEQIKTLEGQVSNGEETSGDENIAATDIKKENIQLLTTSNLNFYVSKTGEVYVTAFSNEQDTSEVKTAVANIQKQYQEYALEGYNEDACGGKPANKISAFKLPIENVISAEHLLSGQGVDGDKVLFLKLDGTISSISLYMTLNENNGEFKINNNVDNLTNIVSMVQSYTPIACSGAYQIMAIEADGTDHILK